MRDPASDPHGSHSKTLVSGGRRVAVALVLWAAVAGLSLWMGRPPEPLGLEAPPGAASGARAMEVLERLARGNAAGLRGVSSPRPAGSEASAGCRRRILEEVRRIGYQPEVQEAFGVHPEQQCAGTVRNILFRRPAPRFSGAPRAEEKPAAVLCMAHYDSVGAGPGIGDDLAGVAALLEVARALGTWGNEQRRDVIFLFEDGEEHGLLGAEVFASQHPWATDVGFVINLEGRGDTGPSRLFETGAGNGMTVAAFAAVASAPSSTSLSAEIYRRMPNDTDYTVWRERGVPGFNFAFIGDKSRYHTPLDDLENLSPSSLQHHVTNASEALQAVQTVALPRDPDEATSEDVAAAVSAAPKDAVFFDLFQRKLVVYSIRTARILAGLTVLLALLAAARTIRAGGARGPGIVLSFGLAALVLMAGAGMTWLPTKVMELVGGGSHGPSHPAHMAPIVVGLFAAALSGVAFASALVARVVRSSEAAIAVMLLFSGLGLAAAWQAPGASFPVSVPAGVMAVAGMVMRTRSDASGRWARASLSGLVAGAVCMTSIHAGVVSAFGVAQPLIAVAPLLFLSLLLWPALQARGAGSTSFGDGRGPALWLGSVCLAAALVASAIAGLLPSHSVVRPGHVNLVHLQSGAGAHWQMNSQWAPVDPAVFRDLGDALRSSGEGAPVVDEAAPSAEVVAQASDEDGRMVTTLRVLPGRSCDQLGVSLDWGELVVGGSTFESGQLRFLAPSEDGELLRVIQRAEGPIRVSLSSKRFGLKGIRGSAADAYYGARPAEFVPVGDGDHSVIRARLTLDGDQLQVDDEDADE